MRNATDQLVTRVAVAGLPAREPCAPVHLDDDAFGRLLDAVTRERITGHLEEFVEAGSLQCTDAQRAALDARHEEMLSIDLVLERLLVETSCAFTTRGIPHRALKGPVAARTFYADPSQRSFGDVDLLVAGEHFDEAIALLVAAGGRARYREPRRHFTARFGKGVCVVTNVGLELDVHRTFVAGPFGLAIDARDLFAAHETIEIGGTAIPVPNNRIRFLHACYHVALTHPRITALRDVAQATTAPDLDADAVLELASRWRGRAVVQRALVLTRARLPATLSGPLYSWADTYCADRFETSALRAHTAPDTSYASQMATGVWALRGVRARAAYGAALLLPDRQYIAEREGSYLRRFAHALSLVRPSRSSP
ncbi:MAG: nucleotidyltransferase family protein [Acidimicrobiia bacterium]